MALRLPDKLHQEGCLLLADVEVIRDGVLLYALQQAVACGVELVHLPLDAAGQFVFDCPVLHVAARKVANASWPVPNLRVVQGGWKRRSDGCNDGCILWRLRNIRKTLLKVFKHLVAVSIFNI